MYLPRGLEVRLADALISSPVVVLEGARGVGKTQLARRLVENGQLDMFLTLADETTLAAALESPKAFVADLPFGTVIDEAQLVPEIQLAIKAVVDSDAAPGRFLLTGSSRLAQDSMGGSAPLAGRSLTLRLEPFTQSERHGTPQSIIQTLFDGNPSDLEFITEHQSKTVDRSLLGGFLPLRSDEQRNSFLDDVLPAAEVGRRDRRDVIAVGRHVARETARMFVAQTIATNLGLDVRTLNGHIELWERLMIVRRLANWRPTHGGTERAQRKILLTDTGLARAWGGLDPFAARGQLIETLVANELIAQGWAVPSVGFLHYREKNRYEVDLVLVRSGIQRELVGVEVKAAAEVRSADFKQLRDFRERSKGHMIRGFVFYTGGTVQSFGDDMWAIPIPALWGPPDSGASALERSVQGLATALRENGSPSASSSRLPRLEALVGEGLDAVRFLLEVELEPIGLAVDFGAPPSEIDRDRQRLNSMNMAHGQVNSDSPPRPVPELTLADHVGPSTHRAISIVGRGRAVIAQINVTASPKERVHFSVAAGRADLDPDVGFGTVSDVQIIEMDSKDLDFSSDSVESAFAELMPHIAALLAQL